MKKSIIFILLIILEFPKGYSQEQQKESKPKVNLLSVSAGFGNNTTDIYNKVSSSINEFNSTTVTTPLIKLFYERNVATVFDDCYLGIGFELAQRRYNMTASEDTRWLTLSSYNGTAEVNVFYFTPRVSLNYVFPNNPKLRAYCNVNLGLVKYSTTGIDNNSHYDYNGNYNYTDSHPYNLTGSTMKTQSYIGIRYFAFNSIGLFAEVGYGMAYINGGLNLRF